MKPPFRRVLQSGRSPMNKRRWLCELDCGHEQWLTAHRAPQRTHCEHCQLDAVKKEALKQAREGERSEETGPP